MSGSYELGGVWQYFRRLDTFGVGRSGARRTGENGRSPTTTVGLGAAALCILWKNDIPPRLNLSSARFAIVDRTVGGRLFPAKVSSHYPVLFSALVLWMGCGQLIPHLWQVKPGDVIACAGFGAGLSWGAAVIRWSGA